MHRSMALPSYRLDPATPGHQQRQGAQAESTDISAQKFGWHRLLIILPDRRLSSFVPPLTTVIFRPDNFHYLIISATGRKSLP